MRNPDEFGAFEFLKRWGHCAAPHVRGTMVQDIEDLACQLITKEERRELEKFWEKCDQEIDRQAKR